MIDLKLSKIADLIDADKRILLCNRSEQFGSDTQIVSGLEPFLSHIKGNEVVPAAIGFLREIWPLESDTIAIVMLDRIRHFEQWLCQPRNR